MHFAEDMDTFEEWYEYLRQGRGVYPKNMILYEDWKEGYINSIQSRSDLEVKELLRYLLSPYTRKLDVDNYEILKNMKILQTEEKNHNNEFREITERTLNLELYYRIGAGQQAWEGLTWVLQLLPHHPQKAIEAIGIYLDSEIGVIPDERIIGLNQCIEIIEEKYIRGKVSKDALIDLEPREFEYLIELLYQELGYSTVLTPATRDGGKDVIARIERPDGKEEVYVECKLYWKTKLSLDSVQKLGYVMNKNNATRGVIFCTGYVNKKIREEDKRIQIWTLEDINFLLNAYLGADWTKRLQILLDNQRRKYEKKG
ncbi:MAG: restriction endonuclease [Clostridium celatum]|nr:restriction endonuclease [Clostridium celatum]